MIDPQFGAWTPCTIALPDDDQTVLISTWEDDEPVLLGYRDADCWRSVYGDVVTVTDWMPLPEPAGKSCQR